MKVKLTLLQAGYCTHPEFIVARGGGLHSIQIPALFALLEHPTRGLILFDTGYAPRFHQETRRFPNRLYAQITPVHVGQQESAVRQLGKLGIAAQDVERVILSHFHADHIAGAKDFPGARFLYFQEAYQAVEPLNGWRAVKAGFLPGLLPADFKKRSIPIPWRPMALPPQFAPFQEAVDLLGDGSLLAVSLPGHAHGQMGVFLQTDQGQSTFLAADACWQSRAFRQLIYPHPLANLAFADPRAYRTTLQRLHQLHCNDPTIEIIPSHCSEALERFQARVTLQPAAACPG